MKKFVDGVEYHSMPEEKPGWCSGCAAINNIPLCNTISDDVCSSKMIYKQTKKEEVKMNVSKLIKQEAIELLECELKSKVEKVYDYNDFKNEIDNAIDEIEDESISIIIMGNINIRKDFLKDATINRIESCCNIFIEFIENDKNDYYDGIYDVKSEARSLLEEKLMVVMINKHLTELQDKYLNEFYDVLESKANGPVINMVKSAIDLAPDDLCIVMVKQMINEDIESLIDSIC